MLLLVYPLVGHVWVISLVLRCDVVICRCDEEIGCCDEMIDEMSDVQSDEVTLSDVGEEMGSDVEAILSDDDPFVAICLS